MLKRLLSLVFTFVLAFNIGLANLTFADDDDAFASQGTPYSGGQKSNVDQCKDEFGNIPDVDCAVRGKILDMKQWGATNGEKCEIGPNKEYDIHLWTYNNIKDFASKMGDFTKTSVQSLLESGTLANALNTSTEGIKNFFNLSSKEQIEEILKRWIIKSKYTDKPEDLDQIISNVLRDLTDVNTMRIIKEIDGKKIGEQKGEGLGQGAGAVGGGSLGAFLGGVAAKTLAVKMAAATVAGGPVVALVGGGLAGAAALGYVGYHALGYAGRKIGGYFGEKSGQKTAEEEIYQKAQEKTSEYNKYNIRADVYASAMDQVFDDVRNLYWKGNDLLLAKLNFDPFYHNAYTEFRKEGFPCENEKIVAQKFEKLSEKLTELLKKYNIRKDL